MLYSNIKGGLVGSFIANSMDETLQCYEIDFIKFYTSIFVGLKYLPVVHSFDNFIAYSKDMKVEDYSLYYVEKKNDKLNYPLNRFELCYGINIKNRLCGLTIISVLRPSKLYPNPAKDEIKTLYENGNLSIDMKKSIVNSLIGMMDKRFNTKSFCSAFASEDECNFTVKVRCEDKAKKIVRKAPDGRDIFIAYSECKTELIDGFKLISYLIKDTANKLLFDLKKSLNRTICKCLV